MLGVTLGVFGNHWVSISLEGAMRAVLHVLVVLLCSGTRAFSYNLPFLGSQPFPPFFFLSLIHYLPSRFSTVLLAQYDGGWGRVFMVGWVASRAGSKVF